MVHGFAAERVEIFFVSLLRVRGGHAVGYVQSRKGSNGVDATTFLQTMPSERFEVAELHVTPGLHMFGDELTILLCGEFGVFLSAGVYDPERSIVKIYSVSGIHHAHIVSAMGIILRRNEVNVMSVPQND